MYIISTSIQPTTVATHPHNHVHVHHIYINSAHNSGHPPTQSRACTSYLHQLSPQQWPPTHTITCMYIISTSIEPTTVATHPHNHVHVHHIYINSVHNSGHPPTQSRACTSYLHDRLHQFSPQQWPPTRTITCMYIISSSIQPTTVATHPHNHVHVHHIYINSAHNSGHPPTQSRACTSYLHQLSPQQWPPTHTITCMYIISTSIQSTTVATHPHNHVHVHHIYINSAHNSGHPPAQSRACTSYLHQFSPQQWPPTRTITCMYIISTSIQPTTVATHPHNHVHVHHIYIN